MKPIFCKECKWNNNGWCNYYECNGNKRVEVCFKYRKDDKKNSWTIPVKITDLDAFQEFFQLYKEMLYDERIDEGIRNEHKSKLDDWLDGMGWIKD